MAQHDIDIIIPTYNQSQLTIKCFQSILRFSNDKIRVIWIDNNSDLVEYTSVKMFANNYPDKFVCVRNVENLGFVKATNQGLDLSTAPYVILMNNDTEAVDGWIEKLRKAFVLFPKCGIVGPLTTAIAPSWQHQTAYQQTPSGFLKTEKLIAFFCAMLSREVVRKVGKLSEDFGIGYGDDNWYCALARHHGFELYLCMDLIIPHYGAATFNTTFSEAQIQSMQRRAREIYHKKLGEL